MGERMGNSSNQTSNAENVKRLASKRQKLNQEKQKASDTISLYDRQIDSLNKERVKIAANYKTKAKLLEEECEKINQNTPNRPQNTPYDMPRNNPSSRPKEKPKNKPTNRRESQPSNEPLLTESFSEPGIFKTPDGKVKLSPDLENCFECKEELLNLLLKGAVPIELSDCPMCIDYLIDYLTNSLNAETYLNSAYENINPTEKYDEQKLIIELQRLYDKSRELGKLIEKYTTDFYGGEISTWRKKDILGRIPPRIEILCDELDLVEEKITSFEATIALQRRKDNGANSSHNISFGNVCYRTESEIIKLIIPPEVMRQKEKRLKEKHNKIYGK